MADGAPRLRKLLPNKACLIVITQVLLFYGVFFIDIQYLGHGIVHEINL